MTAYCHEGYFNRGIETIDPQVHAALQDEEDRQDQGVELIASENIVSRATLDALGAAIDVLGDSGCTPRPRAG